ncbi:uncharacterized protein LOC118434957 isoform X2 [Folsomia candida]|uniref:uncharacterized protein LOC118434957 isoform X2 n=1 Tax=Folsomia candida TaxID=158441 RepID=UPI001604C93F|nr:uncharacterized protein LOC118434957 isoform X2 [Folsomia candida]
MKWVGAGVKPYYTCLARSSVIMAENFTEQSAQLPVTVTRRKTGRQSSLLEKTRNLSQDQIAVQFNNQQVIFTAPDELKTKDPSEYEFQLFYKANDSDDVIRLEQQQVSPEWKERPEGVPKSIFDAIKAHLRWGQNPGETDETMDSSPQFLSLMEEVGDRLTPLICSFTHQDGTITPIQHIGNDVCIRWYKRRNILYKVKENESFGWKGGSNQICCISSCWTISKDQTVGKCRLHSEKSQEVMLLRDINNYDNPTIIIYCPKLKMSPYSEADINKVMSASWFRKDYATINRYMTQREDLSKLLVSPCEPPLFVIDRSIPVPTTLSTRQYSIIGVGTSLLVFFHNYVYKDYNDPIVLLMEQISFMEVDVDFWDEVHTFLNNNGIDFKTSPVSSSHEIQPAKYFPPNIDLYKPYSYIGHNRQGGLYDGASTALNPRRIYPGSSSHSTMETSMTPFQDTIIPLFQQILEDETEMTKLALQAEYLGTCATIIATLLGLETNGRRIYPLTQQIDHHFDSVVHPELLFSLFSIKTGLQLQVDMSQLNFDNGKPDILF